LHINFSNLIYEIIEKVYHSCKKSREIKLITTGKLKNFTIFIDEKLKQNIFINLFSSAIKFSLDAKRITIELSSEKKYTVISITDFGIGISKLELKIIFNPFTRGKSVDLIQGMGLVYLL
jgi:signal transduction histidine kinase|tara:strand:- start:471 stop:830 length:360 start_codon:yes stop_codon:yes gene_type:complete